MVHDGVEVDEAGCAVAGSVVAGCGLVAAGEAVAGSVVAGLDVAGVVVAGEGTAGSSSSELELSSESVASIPNLLLCHQPWRLSCSSSLVGGG